MTCKCQLQPARLLIEMDAGDNIQKAELEARLVTRSVPRGDILADIPGPSVAVEPWLAVRIIKTTFREMRADRLDPSPAGKESDECRSRPLPLDGLPLYPRCAPIAL